MEEQMTFAEIEPSFAGPGKQEMHKTIQECMSDVAHYLWVDTEKDDNNQ